MSDITVAVNSPSDTVNITVPAPDAANISVQDGSAISVTVSPDVAFQSVTNLLDVSGPPTDNQILIYDEDQESFVFIDLSSTGGGSGNITSDIQVTNSDEAFEHISGVTYSVADNVSLETIIRNILTTPTKVNLNFTALSPSSAGVYEVGTSAINVSAITFGVNAGSYQGLENRSVTFNVNEIKTSSFDAIVLQNNDNTQHNLTVGGSNSSYDASSATYLDTSFDVRGTDVLSLSNRLEVSNKLVIKIRVRHLLYGNTTELAQGASQADTQAVYDAIVTASSALATEQLKDRADDYTYSNTSNKYNLATDANYTYYFYEASLGELSDIKLGGSQGLDIDDAFIHITNGGAISLSNGEVSTDYHVYRSRNPKAFSSGQSIYFKN